MSPFYLCLHLILSLDVKGKRAYPFGPISFFHLAFSFNYFKLLFFFPPRFWESKCSLWGFPGGASGRESVSNPLQYFCLGNPVDRGARWAIGLRVAKSWTQLKWLGIGPGVSDGKESACNVGDLGSIPGSGRFPWIGKWQPTPVFLPGESPWIEEPGGLIVHCVAKSQTWLSN